MKAITIWQPYASLIAEGVKTIETRSWKAPAALVGERIAIHAAKRDTDSDVTIPEACWDALGRCIGGAAPVRGAVVATARLTACVPMVEMADDVPDAPELIEVIPDGRLIHWPEGAQLDVEAEDWTDQLPYGDFAPGRWAWMLDDITPTTERCPADCRIIAGDGEDDFDDERGGHRVLTGTTKVGGGTLEAWATCPVCDGAGKCEPIPAKGRQRLWEWTR